MFWVVEGADPYKSSATFPVGEGLAPPELFPLYVT